MTFETVKGFGSICDVCNVDQTDLYLSYDGLRTFKKAYFSLTSQTQEHLNTPKS